MSHLDVTCLNYFVIDDSFYFFRSESELRKISMEKIECVEGKDSVYLI